VHACGLVHRDVKPSNIILGEDQVPRLVDFGLAAHLGSTALRDISGSPPYMAPEQARGQWERIDARTDVYGLGAVLYHLLTGEPPRDGKTPHQILEQVRDEPIVPPRRRNPRIPRALERVCLKAMAADPESRFQSASAVRVSLRRYRLIRRAAPLAGATVAVIALLATAGALRSGLIGHLPEGQAGAIAGGATVGPRTDSKPVPPSELRVVRFEISHFPKHGDRYDPVRSGLLGRVSFIAGQEDDVAVQARLSEPAYSYLIAFRPDGTDELCDPGDEGMPPPQKLQPMYPPPEHSDKRYRLSEGPGLYAFTLVVSRQPLRPYREWKRLSGRMAWSAGLPCDPGVVWRDEGDGPQPLMDGAPKRGKNAQARDSGASVLKLASWLRGLPGVDVVVLEAFSVEPASNP
jgi:serine/threonine protein kinase